MSGNTTVSGTTVVSQFTSSAGSPAALAALNQLGSLSFSVDTVNGSFSATGPVAIGPGITDATISGATVVLSNAPNATLSITGGNAQIFAAPGDTISATGADTLFGPASGTTTFLASGANSSIVGGAGNLIASVSGANSTLIGGTGTNTFSVSGAGSDVVAGPAPGITNVTLTDTGGAQIATNPNGGSGTLVATLSSTGADTVIGGGGNSTITGGGGSDVFGFVSGHAGGTELIMNFTSSDMLAFGGYSGSAIHTEAFTAGAGGAGTDVITLTDGTVITVEGQLSHSIFGLDK